MIANSQPPWAVPAPIAAPAPIAGHHLRLVRAELVNIGRHKGRRIVRDFGAMPPGIIRYAGPVGAGKTSEMVLSSLGTWFQWCPNRGDVLNAYPNDGESSVQLDFWARGRLYRARTEFSVGEVTRGQNKGKPKRERQCFLWVWAGGSWEAVPGIDGLVSRYQEHVEQLVGPLSYALQVLFGFQRGGAATQPHARAFAEVEPRERKAFFRDLLGLDDMTAAIDAATARAAEGKAAATALEPQAEQIKALRAALAEAEEQRPAIEAAAAHAATRLRRAELEAEAAVAAAARGAAEQAAEQAAAARADAEAASRRAEAAREHLADLRQQVAAIEQARKRRDEAEARLAQLRAAESAARARAESEAGDAARIRTEIATAYAALPALEATAHAARSALDAAQAREAAREAQARERSTAERALSSARAERERIAREAAAAEATVARLAGPVDAARAELPGLDARVRDLEGRIADMLGRDTALRARWSEQDRAAHAAEHEATQARAALADGEAEAEGRCARCRQPIAPAEALAALPGLRAAAERATGAAETARAAKAETEAQGKALKAERQAADTALATARAAAQAARQRLADAAALDAARQRLADAGPAAERAARAEAEAAESLRACQAPGPAEDTAPLRAAADASARRVEAARAQAAQGSQADAAERRGGAARADAARTAEQISAAETSMPPRPEQAPPAIQAADAEAAETARVAQAAQAALAAHDRAHAAAEQRAGACRPEEAIREELAALGPGSPDEAPPLAEAREAAAQARGAMDRAAGSRSQLERQIAGLGDVEAQIAQAADEAAFRAEVVADLQKVLMYRIEAAGPAVAARVNELLEAGFGGRWAVSILTETPNKTNAGSRERYEVLVSDTDPDRNRICRLHELSGGEQSIVRLALQLGLALWKNEQSEWRTETVWLDEPDASLGAGERPALEAIIRRFLEIGGFWQVFLTTHGGDIIHADYMIDVESGGEDIGAGAGQHLARTSRVVAWAPLPEPAEVPA